MAGRAFLRLKTLAAAAAFAAPFAFAACDLVPFAVPGDTPTTTSGTGAGGTSFRTGGTSSGTGGTSSGTAGTSSGTAGSSSGTAGTSSGTAGAGGTTSAGGSGGATTSTGGAGGATTTTGAGGAVLDGGPDGAGDASACGAIETIHPIEPGIHVASCTPLTYATNPPTSGSHYPIWAAFKTYTSAVPRGFYVHSLEHGAVVIGYNCPAGCDADLALLQAYLDARPADPLCVAPLKNRFIVTPDPLLDVPFAAAAWGASLESTCLDLPALGAFIDAHYAKSPENFCFDGTDVTAPGSGIPAGCGEIADAGSD